MKIVMLMLLVSAAPVCNGTTPPPADGGAVDMTVAVPGQLPPDLSASQDGISAPGACHIPAMPCGGNFSCATDEACYNGNCVPVCLDAMQCPMLSIHPCPTGYLDAVIGCFLPCFATQCATGCSVPDAG